MIVNGREYPMWSQFIERKEEHIGKDLEEFEGDEMSSTKITDLTLLPNGNDSAMFTVEGEDFSCGFDVRNGGIAAGEEGCLTFQSVGGLKFRING